MLLGGECLLKLGVALEKLLVLTDFVVTTVSLPSRRQ